jgi:hypothetical protein
MRGKKVGFERLLSGIPEGRGNKAKEIGALAREKRRCHRLSLWGEQKLMPVMAKRMLL